MLLDIDAIAYFCWKELKKTYQMMMSPTKKLILRTLGLLSTLFLAPVAQKLCRFGEKCHLHVLIDSGSTHCFVNALVSHKLGLPIETRPTLNVSMANGSQLRCSGVSRGVQILLGSACFSVDLFLIPLGEFGVVLGVIWLCTLGPINWDSLMESWSSHTKGSQSAYKEKILARMLTTLLSQ